MELNSANYYGKDANLAFFSASQIKSLKKCEAMAMAEIRGEYERPMSTALTVGQYVDEALTGDLDSWLMRHPEICKRDGTLKAEYLQAAEKIAENFTAHIRADGLTDCDFCQPAGEERIDNIAGAIAACGLQELALLTGEEAWKQQAERLVKGLLDSCTDWGPEHCGILTRCTASYHDDGAGRHTNILYGDYFLVEALMKLCGRDPELWS